MHSSTTGAKNGCVDDCCWEVKADQSFEGGMSQPSTLNVSKLLHSDLIGHFFRCVPTMQRIKPEAFLLSNVSDTTLLNHTLQSVLYPGNKVLWTHLSGRRWKDAEHHP